jgi:hypothetical protein
VPAAPAAAQPHVPSVPARSPAAAQPQGRHKEKPEPPSVAITIGRVELRAPPQPAPRPAAPRWSGPAVSLDDYLHDRGARP